MWLLLAYLALQSAVLAGELPSQLLSLRAVAGEQASRWVPREVGAPAMFLHPLLSHASHTIFGLKGWTKAMYSSTWERTVPAGSSKCIQASHRSSDGHVQWLNRALPVLLLLLFSFPSTT